MSIIPYYKPCWTILFPADKKHTVTPTDEKLSLKKVLDLVNKSDDHGLRDMNKKLQNMLEETLTKNMHLQKVGCCYFTIWYKYGKFLVSIPN
mgnify:CR=1 FL=1